jgi:DNA-binding transcriptional regulator GbsR (MarR family)
LPLTLQDLKERLSISLGSTSQGLQIFQEVGAVRSVKIPNQRRTHFEAVAELRNLAGSFLRKQISKHLKDSGTRLKRLKKHTRSLNGEAKDHAVGRVRMLES